MCGLSNGLSPTTTPSNPTPASRKSPFKFEPTIFELQGRTISNEPRRPVKKGNRWYAIQAKSHYALSSTNRTKTGASCSGETMTPVSLRIWNKKSPQNWGLKPPMGSQNFQPANSKRIGDRELCQLKVRPRLPITSQYKVLLYLPPFDRNSNVKFWPPIRPPHFGGLWWT